MSWARFRWGTSPSDLELVNAIVEKVERRNADAIENLSPASEDVQNAPLAPHRRTSWRAWNWVRPSPPKRPEAMALQFIDNLDARLEMFAAGYDSPAKPLATRIFDRVPDTLPGNLVNR